MEIQEEKQKVEPQGIPHRCWWLEGLKYIGEKKPCEDMVVYALPSLKLT